VRGNPQPLKMMIWLPAKTIKRKKVFPPKNLAECVRPGELKDKSYVRAVSL